MRRVLLIWLCLMAVAFAQNLEEHWVTDFSGGIRPDLSPAMMPDNAMIKLHNGIIDGTSIKLRPGYSLWKKRIDALSDGSSPKAVDDEVYGVRALHEFYNDITGRTQVLAVINDEVWWADTDSTNWHRIGLSAGTLTATKDDSIVVGADVDWWPRMLPQDGGDWTLHTVDSAEGVYKVIGNKILLDGQWKPATASGAKYELVPVFDSTKNLHFTTVNQTCFISDGTRPVVQWSNHTIDNGYFIVDSTGVVDSINQYSSTSYYMYMAAPGLTMDLLDENSEWIGTGYTVCVLDSDSNKIHFPRIYLGGSYRTSWAECDSNITGNNVYLGLPVNSGYNFEPDTVYSGVLDGIVQGTEVGVSVVLDTSQLWGLDEFNAGIYDLVLTDSTGDSRMPRDPTPKYRFYAAEVDTDFGGGNKTYTGLRVIYWNNAETGCDSIESIKIGDLYHILKYTYFPHTHFTQWRKARMWYLASPLYPNAAWYSKQLGWAGLITTNYYDDISTVDYETIGAGDGDEIMGLSLMQQWLIAYKRHHMYAISTGSATGTALEPDVYLKSSNYGLWSDGFLLSYMEKDLGLNRLGLFSFNSAAVEDHRTVSAEVSPFFTDSLNLAEMDIVRGELYNDYILFSFPSGSNTSNDKTLAVDTKTGAWSTWSIAAGSYLTRRAPGSLDTLLFGSPDSASIFVMGGTSDAGTAIEMIYKSPFLDFGTTAWKKQLRKVQITGQFNVNSSLSVFVYTDSLHDESYGDTVACSVLLGYKTPQDVLFELPSDIEEATRISIEVRSIAADSLRIDKIGYFYTKSRKVGSQ